MHIMSMSRSALALQSSYKHPENMLQVTAVDTILNIKTLLNVKQFINRLNRHDISENTTQFANYLRTEILGAFAAAERKGWG
jgi:hypothetical protein